MKRYGFRGDYGYGYERYESDDGVYVTYEDAQAAIKAAVLAEREAVLLLAENVMTDCGLGLADREYMVAAIRARSKK